MNNTMKDISSQKYRSTKLNININLAIVGILIFTIYFSTLKSFLLPFYVGLVLLICSVIILVFGNLIIHKRSVIITRIDVMWLLFLGIFIMNIAFKNIISPVTLIDTLVYFSGIVFLLMVKVDINDYDLSFKLIKFLGLIYAFSAIFQYLYTDIYLSNLLPLFTPSEQTSILKLLRSNSYSGITNQTAHLAGYIVSAIGIILFSKWSPKFRNKVIIVISLLVLFIGLLLTAKRAHLIFMIIAIVATILISINNKNVMKNVIKIVSGILAILLLTFALFTFLEFKEDSPIIEFITELENTVNGVFEGEDVTSGRITLYKRSFEYFVENPIFGIGWKEFINNSLGLINTDEGSHPHNIYIQLLAEMGLIGLFFFIAPVIYLYYKTFAILRVISAEKKKTLIKWKAGIQFSFFSQTFLLFYGLTGNILTDYNFLMLYFFVASISLSALINLKWHKVGEDNC